MNDIPRYRPVANDRYGITDDADGKLCEYRDYARLKAEVERLTNCKSEADRLKAEVERLQQEKNELAVMIHPVALKAWMNLNAANEGNQP